MTPGSEGGEGPGGWTPGSEGGGAGGWTPRVREEGLGAGPLGLREEGLGVRTPGSAGGGSQALSSGSYWKVDLILTPQCPPSQVPQLSAMCEHQHLLGSGVSAGLLWRHHPGHGLCRGSPRRKGLLSGEPQGESLGRGLVPGWDLGTRGPQEQEDQGRPPSHPQRSRKVVTARLSPSCSPLGMDLTFRVSVSSPVPWGQVSGFALPVLGLSSPYS